MGLYAGRNKKIICGTFLRSKGVICHKKVNNFTENCLEHKKKE